MSFSKIACISMVLIKCVIISKQVEMYDVYISEKYTKMMWICSLVNDMAGRKI